MISEQIAMRITDKAAAEGKSVPVSEILLNSARLQGDAANLEWIGHILPHRHVLKQGIGLKHNPQFTLLRRQDATNAGQPLQEGIW